MRVLITGQNGYIATRLKAALGSADGFEAETVSVRGKLPRLVGYDAVVHAAGIVHRKAVSDDEYRAVNIDLTLSLAQRAKDCGVKQFIFLSSMAVYGQDGEIGKPLVIHASTPARPKTMYGHSKWAAEEGLRPLAQPDFAVAILRIPMLYGDDCPGNYARLQKLARYTPIFPLVRNERSTIHIDTLCLFIRRLLALRSAGLFLPQDDAYACTSELVAHMAAAYGRSIVLSPFLGRLVTHMPLPVIRKMFGNLVYARDEEVSP